MQQLRTACPPESDRSTTAHQINYQHHECKNQQNVNQTTCNVRTETKQPQNQKNYENCPKHLFILLAILDWVEHLKQP